MKKKAWDMLSVREWEDVSHEVEKKNKKVHVGRVFEICVKKGSELPANDPLRKLKGRLFAKVTTSRMKAVKSLSSMNFVLPQPTWKLVRFLMPIAMHLATLANRQTANRRTPKPHARVLKLGFGQ